MLKITTEVKFSGEFHFWLLECESHENHEHNFTDDEYGFSRFSLYTYIYPYDLERRDIYSCVSHHDCEGEDEIFDLPESWLVI